MTDFLSGLLDRALNRMPVLQPRRPSLFEPVPDGAQPAPSAMGRWRQEREAAGSGLETAEMRESPEMGEPFTAPRFPSRRQPTVPPASLPENWFPESHRFSQAVFPIAPLSEEDRGITGHTTIDSTEKKIAKAATPTRFRTGEMPLDGGIVVERPE